ncbi:MAG: hypothetical protein EBU88_18285, partial [Acidobacteria bacterium]|nr:hypothetical protein [Acidobacteriota bacterium]
QADQGETRAQELADYVQSQGGEIRHSCAYSPEQQAMIERFWRTIAELATAMLLSSKLGEPFWEDATRYATMVYNHTPRYHPGRSDMVSPIELYTKERHHMRNFKPFGCRAYVHIPSQIRRKNHKGRAEQAIFVGMSEGVLQGYIFYRPLYRDYVTSVHAVFAPVTPQGSTSSPVSVDMTNSDVPEGKVEDFQYLEGTYHLDEEDGLLYTTLWVAEEVLNRRRDRFIVGFRCLVMPHGGLSDKCDNEPVHIRDIERMTLQTESGMVDNLIPGRTGDRHQRPQGSKRATSVNEDQGGFVDGAGSQAGSMAV